MPRKRSTEPPRELLTLGSRLRYARDHRDMKQNELARLSKVDAAQLSRLESGQSGAGVEAATIIRIARALNVSVGWLLADEGQPTPPEPPVFREHPKRGGKGS